MQLSKRIGHRDIDAAALKRRDVFGDIQARAVFVVERDNFLALGTFDAVLNGSDFGFQLSVCLGKSVGRTFLVELFKGLIRSKDGLFDFTAAGFQILKLFVQLGAGFLDVLVGSFGAGQRQHLRNTLVNRSLDLPKLVFDDRKLFYDDQVILHQRAPPA